MNIWLIRYRAKKRLLPFLLLLGAGLALLANIQGAKDFANWAYSELFPPTAAELAQNKQKLIANLDALVKADKWDAVDDTLATIDQRNYSDVVSFFTGMKEWTVRSLLKDPEQRFQAISPDSLLYRRAVFMLMRLYTQRRPGSNQESLFLALASKMEGNGYKGVLLFSTKMLALPNIKDPSYYEQILSEFDISTSNLGREGKVEATKGRYFAASIEDVGGIDVLRATLHGFISMANITANRKDEFTRHFSEYCRLMPVNHSDGTFLFTKLVAPFDVISMIDQQVSNTAGARCNKTSAKAE